MCRVPKESDFFDRFFIREKSLWCSRSLIHLPLSGFHMSLQAEQMKGCVMAKKKLLTEKELLAMPKKDYMNERQVEFFRNRLQMMEAQLQSNANQTTENLRETTVVPDPADRATLEEERTFELRTRDRERKLLKKVQAALRRIDNGEYGWCEETGEPIGVARLLARPTTTLSLEAQERREIRQKMYGD